MPNWVVWVVRLLGTAAGLWLAWHLQSTLVILAFALLLTAAFMPVVDWLDAQRLPHWASVSLCFLALLGGIAGFFAYLGPLLVTQTTELFSALGGVSLQLEAMEARWADWQQRLPLLPEMETVTQWLTSQDIGWLQSTLGATGRVVRVVVEGGLVLLLAFFFLKDGPRLLHGPMRLLPEGRREEARNILVRIADRVGRYMLGKLVIMAMVGILTTIGLLIVGMPYAVILGVVAGLLDIIPYAGPFLAAAPALVIALFQSWQLALWVGLVYFAAQQLESYVITPLVLGRSVELHPAWILIALLVGAELAGIIGMILAVPIASTIQILVEEIYLKPRDARHDGTPGPQGVEPTVRTAEPPRRWPRLRLPGSGR